MERREFMGAVVRGSSAAALAVAVSGGPATTGFKVYGATLDGDRVMVGLEA